MNNEIIARGTPSKRLPGQERCPSVASSGTNTSATGIQEYLLTPPTFDFCRVVELVIAPSVAYLHASKNRRAHHDQGLLRFIRIGWWAVACRLGGPAQNSLAPCRPL